MLTFTGAFIPTCSKISEEKADGTYDNECTEDNFDFANAFVGTIGGVKFENYGESLKQKLSLTSLSSWYNYKPDSIPGKKKINPTLGTLHCYCFSNDGGAAKFNKATKLYESAYEKYVKADD